MAADAAHPPLSRQSNSDGAGGEGGKMQAGHGIPEPELSAQEGHRRTDGGLEIGEQAEQEVGRPGAPITNEGGGFGHGRNGGRLR